MEVHNLIASSSESTRVILFLWKTVYVINRHTALLDRIKFHGMVRLVWANSGAASISLVCPQTSDRMNTDSVFVIADRVTTTNNLLVDITSQYR